MRKELLEHISSITYDPWLPEAVDWALVGSYAWKIGLILSAFLIVINLTRVHDTIRYIVFAVVLISGLIMFIGSFLSPEMRDFFGATGMPLEMIGAFGSWLLLLFMLWTGKYEGN